MRNNIIPNKNDSSIKYIPKRINEVTDTCPRVEQRKLIWTESNESIFILIKVDQQRPN